MGQRARDLFVRFAGRAIAHEFLVLLAFCLFTAVLTWPYVTRLRDVVVDEGDPYLMAWIIWWDYHATFTDPLNLFHANLFYPYRYTLAFSENCYGTALLFFPLFALGLRPLTVHAVAMFFGFVLCGYGAFRLARTLTGSEAIGWVAGIIFAFVPYRFHTMSQLPYVFAAWIPLLFEALVLFVRRRSWGRAAWLGFAFLMSGLTTISWHILSIVPFVLAAAILLTRYQLWRDREFWLRGAVGLGLGSLLLLPFMLPYVMVAKLYGFTRSIEEVKGNSAWPSHWLSVENRNKLWSRMGEGVSEGWRFKLFPGLLPILFSLAAILLVDPIKGRVLVAHREFSRNKWLKRLDILIFATLAISILAIGFDRTDAFGKLFSYITSERALALLTVAVLVRLCLAYPAFLRATQANFIETLRSTRRCDAFWLGILLTVVGFCFSLGWNFFVYRICYDLLPMFAGMRVASRGAMLAYLGLSLLAGLGVKRLAEAIAERRPRVGPGAVVATACALLLFELNAAPLQIIRGDVFPDAVTLRLKETPMRGGIVILPAGGAFNYRHMLRAADHGRPLIVGTSGFNPPYENEIESLIREGPIRQRFMDLLEEVPASYLVVQQELIKPDRRVDYEVFIARVLAAGRLRFIKRFDGRADLYAVTKTEPGARSEETLPFGLSIREWAALVENDPVHVLSHYRNWSQTLFRLNVATFGAMPRYRSFLGDMRVLGRDVWPGMEDQEAQLERNLREFTDDLTRRADFTNLYSRLDDAQYVDRLLANAGISMEPTEKAALIAGLANKLETRAATLLKVVNDPRFVEKENHRSLVVLHFFGYFRRNPDDPPDNDLRGMEHWIQDLQRNNDPDRISKAFNESIEYQQLKRGVAVP